MKAFLSWLESRRRLVELAVLGLAAVLVFQVVLDWRILPFSSIDWLFASADDSGRYYLAFLYYRYAGWHLPVTRIDTMLYPVGASIAVADGIPLLAIPAKALSRALPEHFQYFGVWLFACIFLNGYFAKRLLESLVERRALVWLGVILVMAAPPLVNRFNHCALSAHFLILWAFCLVNERSRVPTQGVWLLSALSLFVHPYLAAMVNGLLLGVPWVHRKQRKEIAILAVGWAGAFLGSAWLLGYFGLKSAGGLQVRHYLADLTVLFSSEGSSSILPELPGQRNYWEGFAYLGLGGILLLLALIVNAILRRFERRSERDPSSAGVIVVLSLLMACFAFSPSPSFMGERLSGIPALTEAIQPLASIFRSGGRFIWPLFYFILLFGLRAVDELVARVRFPKAGNAAAFAILAAQIFDIGPWLVQNGKAEALLNPPPIPGVSDKVRARVTPNTRFMIFDPPVQRAPCRGKRPWRHGYLPLALFAAQERLTVNTDFGASARLTRQDLDAVCRFGTKSVRKSKRDPSVVVVRRRDLD